ncbi:hypothetical protein V6N13_026660 [Hibiscus sabdariffa]
MSPLSAWFSGFLKLNLDGFVNRLSSRGRISGLLRDEFGSTIHLFFEIVGVSASDLRELEDILVGISKFTDSDWSSNFRLIVESNYKIIVDWLSGSVEPLPTVLAVVMEVAEVIWVRNFLLWLIPQVCNVEAYILTKEGIG